MRLRGLRDVTRDVMTKIPRICKEFFMTCNRDVSFAFLATRASHRRDRNAFFENAALTHRASTNVRQLATALPDDCVRHADHQALLGRMCRR
jgi:hypothetical protein